MPSQPFSRKGSVIIYGDHEIGRGEWRRYRTRRPIVGNNTGGTDLHTRQCTGSDCVGKADYRGFKGVERCAAD